MTEIEKLRLRLKNVQRNVTEYRMTVTEAKDLLKEIDNLSKLKIEKSVEPIQQDHAEPIVRIIDGGEF